MAGTVQSIEGTALPLANLPTTITYAGALVETISVVYRGLIYTQTFTNNGTQITGFTPFQISGVASGS